MNSKKRIINFSKKNEKPFELNFNQESSSIKTNYLSNKKYVPPGFQINQYLKSESQKEPPSFAKLPNEIPLVEGVVLENNYFHIFKKRAQKIDTAKVIEKVFTDINQSASDNTELYKLSKR